VTTSTRDTDATGVDLDRLATWMDQQGLPRGAITEVERLTGGTQNILLRFCRGGNDYVLRRPPIHKRAKSDETMRREARVLAALRESPVPHPGLIAACGDTDVLGCAFYLMAPIDGFNPASGLPTPHRDDPAIRHQMGLAIADAAAALSQVDVDAAGIGDLGRREGYLERQAARWQKQLESYRELPGYSGSDLPSVDAVGEWLDINRPASWQPGLVHGDFHLANVMFSPSGPELVAVVDWEMATIGDPLLDLAWLLATWRDDDDHAAAVVPIEPWSGFPIRDELIARYRDASGRDLTALPWFEVLACYKLGIVLEGTHARACAGQADKPTGDRLHAAALSLLQRAGRLVTQH
jgi:aminoglycoside phosphotransferase (APT) family kinase protein